MRKIISFVSNITLDCTAYICCMIFMCLTLNNGVMINDIFTAFKRDWKVVFWLLASIICHFVAFSFFLNVPGLNLMFNIIGTAILCIFINFITRDYSDVIYDKDLTESLSKIKQELEKATNTNDIHPILKMLDAQLEKSKFRAEILQKKDELDKVNNPYELIRYANTIIDKYPATAGTSGLSQYIK